jgi:hypothetical protein
MRITKASPGCVLCRQCSLALLLLVLVLPAQAMAQELSDRPSFRRFAVGGGFLFGSAVCIECDEPGTPGAIGGFEVRLSEDLSIVTEGVWTRGYEVSSLERDGVSYPYLTHDYFAFLEAKLRWEFSSLRHRPYLVVGGAAKWHRDTQYNYGGGVVDGRWTFDFDDVRIREEMDTGAGLVVGFGWAFKVGERLEVRPEADLYMGRGSFARIGVVGWFNF